MDSHRLLPRDRCKHSEGDGAVSSYDVMTVSYTSRSEDGITNIQTVRSMKQF